MTQKTVDTMRQAQSKKCAVFFSAKHIKKILPYTPFPCYPLRVSNPAENTTPDWIAELIAATGRFEALCDHSTEWAEKFCEECKKDVAFISGN
jgi:hypothetical protein